MADGAVGHPHERLAAAERLGLDLVAHAALDPHDRRARARAAARQRLVGAADAAGERHVGLEAERLALLGGEAGQEAGVAAAAWPGVEEERVLVVATAAPGVRP